MSHLRSIDVNRILRKFNRKFSISADISVTPDYTMIDPSFKFTKLCANIRNPSGVALNMNCMCQSVMFVLNYFSKSFRSNSIYESNLLYLYTTSTYFLVSFAVTPIYFYWFFRSCMRNSRCKVLRRTSWTPPSGSQSNRGCKPKRRPASSQGPTLERTGKKFPSKWSRRFWLKCYQCFDES